MKEPTIYLELNADDAGLLQVGLNVAGRCGSREDLKPRYRELASRVEALRSESLGMNSEDAEGLRIHWASNPDESTPVAAKDEDMPSIKQAYILPNGKMYACLYHGHANLATRLIVMLDGEIDDELDPEKEADKRGWLRICHSIVPGIGWTCMATKKLTKKQNDTFLFWSAHHGLTEDDLTKLF